MPTIKNYKASSQTYSYGRVSYYWIVIHYTATNASAYNNAVYFSGGNRNASAHYFVDGTDTIWCSVPPQHTAWHAGNWYVNQRSIGIEVVSAGQDFTEKEIQNLAWLVQTLMKQYSIPASRVIRHYDVAKYAQGSIVDPYKKCPAPYVNDAKWKVLWRRIVGQTSGSTTEPYKPSQSSSTIEGKVDIKYALRTTNGLWLDPVINFNNTNSDGYAGIPYSNHDKFWATVSEGSIKYRLHDIIKGWGSWHKDGKIAEALNGIDGIQLYYTTPSGKTLKQVYYRSQTTERAGWLDVCCDDGTSYDGFDGWAGMYKEPLDRLQCAVSSSNPF